MVVHIINSVYFFPTNVLCVLQVNDVKMTGSSAQVTKLDFCSVSLLLAVGSECGLVRNLSY